MNRRTYLSLAGVVSGGPISATLGSQPARANGTEARGGSLYALDAGVDGSSEGSRVQLGTLGHHHDWIDAPAQTIDVEDPDGREYWRFELEASVRSPPTIVDETVFFRSERIYAIDAATGEMQWDFETELPGRDDSSPQVIDGTVFAADRGVYALDADTGEQRWWFNPGDSSRGPFSTPTVTDETVFVGRFTGHNGRVHAIDTATGDEEWHFDTDGEVVAAPTIVENRVFVAADALYALTADSGEQEWQSELDGGGGFSAPTVVDGTVFVGSQGGNITAVDAETGEEQWRFEIDGDISSSPTVVGGTLFIGSADDHVYALNTETGEEQWRFVTGGSVRSSPTVANGTVFVGSNDTYVYALDAETGEERWQFETGTNVVSSPTVVDGILFIGNDKHTEPEPTGGHPGEPEPEPEPDPDPEPEPEPEPDPEPEDQSGFGVVGALTALGGFGYLLKQRLIDNTVEGE